MMPAFVLQRIQTVKGLRWKDSVRERKEVLDMYLTFVFDVKLTSLRATKGVARVIIYIAVSCVLLKIIGNRLLRLCVLLCLAFCHVPRIMFSRIV